MDSRDQQYRTQEFAKRAGITVRTLHHYDRVGLLHPRRTQNGYRAYCDRDLERLEQVVALKFVGLSLKQIKTLLDRDSPELGAALRMQRRILLAKRSLLDDAIEAIGQAELKLKSGKRPRAEVLKKIIEVIAMQNDTDWMLKYQNDAAKAKMAERGQTWSPELQERVSGEWMQLIGDVEAALGQDPEGETGQALAERWLSLVEEFTGRDQDVAASVGSLYADSQNWPAHFKKQMQPFRIGAEVWAFIGKAMEKRKRDRP